MKKNYEIKINIAMLNALRTIVLGSEMTDDVKADMDHYIWNMIYHETALLTKDDKNEE